MNESVERKEGWMNECKDEGVERKDEWMNECMNEGVEWRESNWWKDVKITRKFFLEFFLQYWSSVLGTQYIYTFTYTSF